MSKITKIALIGDFNQEVTAHLAIPRALEITATMNELELDYKWLNTRILIGNLEQTLSSFDAIWAVPASPYENMAGALSAIRYARENKIPFLGTCGGYQHAILEFAHNVLNLQNAQSAEVNPETEFPLINSLVCSLVEISGQIFLTDNTKICEVYGTSVIKEQYHCSYGFNREYLDIFSGSDLVISGFDGEGDPRSIELNGHPFFIGTAYQPERDGLDGKNHPLVNQFVLAARNRNE